MKKIRKTCIYETDVIKSSRRACSNGKRKREKNGKNERKKSIKNLQHRRTTTNDEFINENDTNTLSKLRAAAESADCIPVELVCGRRKTEWRKDESKFMIKKITGFS